MIVVPLIILAGLVYARGAGALRSGRVWRSLLFFLGLTAIVASLASPVDALAHQLFSAHMVQHMLLTVVGAPLLLLGQPVRPLLRGLPRGVRRWVIRPLARSPLLRTLLHLLRRPLITGALYVVGLYAWHVPTIYDAALMDPFLHSVEHAYFLLSALLFWSIVIDPEPFRSPLPYPVRIVFLVLSGAAQNTILGGLLSFSSRLLYPYYEGRPEAFGIDALTDQRFGGATMWVPGDLIFLAAASVCFFLFLDQEEREQNAREREVKVEKDLQTGPTRRGA